MNNLKNTAIDLKRMYKRSQYEKSFPIKACTRPRTYTNVLEKGHNELYVKDFGDQISGKCASANDIIHTGTFNGIKLNTLRNSSMFLRLSDKHFINNNDMYLRLILLIPFILP